ncbi:transposase, partial [Citreicella sp. C3M06]|uniref:transposase n=1 Tax=Citreicella sp. C3M06 TaxID=2841564 RepID=UPI00209043F0
ACVRGWFDPEMSRDAVPTGRRGRQQTFSGKEHQKIAWGAIFPTNAIQTCLTMKVLFGMALRQTTGFVESLLRFVGLNWQVPDFSTLSRRQKA